MTTYTTPHNLPQLETTDLIKSPTGDNLRKQINALSTASNSALDGVKTAAADDATTKANTAKTDAINDADTKYGGLPDRVASLEGSKWDKGTFSADLDTAQASGRWTVNATNVPNLPVAVAGELSVAWGGTTGTQTYTTRATPVAVYHRRYASGAWGSWNQGAVNARIDSVDNPRSLNAGESLDTLLTQGHYMQTTVGQPLLSLGYPVEKIGYLRVRRWNSAGTHVVQEYFPLDERAFYTRIIYSSVPRPWRRHEDAADTRAYVDAGVAAIKSDPAVTTPRKLVEHTEAGHPFYMSSGAGSWELNDTTDFAVGSQSLRITTNGAGTAANLRADNIGPLNLRDNDLQVWIKIDDWATNAGMSLYLGTNTLNNYYRWSIDSPHEKAYLIAGSWHLLTIPFASFNQVAGSPDRANLTHMQLRGTDNSSGPLTFRLGPMYEIPKSRKFPNGVVSFSFDDTLLSLYTHARRIMDKYGFGGTAYITPEIIGGTGTASMQQLRLMQDRSGWEIAGHSFTSQAHNDRFTSLTEAQLDTELANLAQWLKDNHFNGTSVAYPGGQYNDLVSEVTLRHFKAGRTIAPFWETLPPGNPGAINTAVYVLSGTTTVEHMQAMVDQAWDEGYWLHICFHDVLPDAEVTQTTDYPTSGFDAICAYIAAKGIPMRTVADVLEEVL